MSGGSSGAAPVAGAERVLKVSCQSAIDHGQKVQAAGYTIEQFRMPGMSRDGVICFRGVSHEQSPDKVFEDGFKVDPRWPHIENSMYRTLPDPEAMDYVRRHRERNRFSPYAAPDGSDVPLVHPGSNQGFINVTLRSQIAVEYAAKNILRAATKPVDESPGAVRTNNAASIIAAIKACPKVPGSDHEHIIGYAYGLVLEYGVNTADFQWQEGMPTGVLNESNLLAVGDVPPHDVFYARPVIATTKLSVYEMEGGNGMKFDFRLGELVINSRAAIADEFIGPFQSDGAGIMDMNLFRPPEGATDAVGYIYNLPSHEHGHFRAGVDTAMRVDTTTEHELLVKRRVKDMDSYFGKEEFISREALAEFGIGNFDSPEALFRAACAVGDWEKVSQLILARVNVYACDSMKRNAAHYAAMRRGKAGSGLLLDLFQQYYDKAPSEADLRDCFKGRLTVISQLLAEGVAFDAPHIGAKSAATLMDAQSRTARARGEEADLPFFKAMTDELADAAGKMPVTLHSGLALLSIAMKEAEGDFGAGAVSRTAMPG